MPTQFRTLEDFPHLRRPNDDAVLQVEIVSPSSPGARDSGYVSLRVRDAHSGIVLVDLQMDPARFWRLLQGSIQTWPGFVSPHLDRFGKTMENKRVLLPAPLDGDTDRDIRRDVRNAVRQQLPEDWWETWESHDEPSRNNRGEWSVTVRRWVTTTEES